MSHDLTGITIIIHNPSEHSLLRDILFIMLEQVSVLYLILQAHLFKYTTTGSSRELNNTDAKCLLIICQCFVSAFHHFNKPHFIFETNKERVLVFHENTNL